MSLIRRIMTKNVITFSPDTAVEDAIRGLVEHQISGAPVVDATGRLVGIISEFQLLSLIHDEHVTPRTPIRELMTADVVTIDPSTPLVDVAQAFVSLRIRRLPVVEEGRLVGLISRRDVLRYAVTHGAEERALRGVAAETAACCP